MGEVGEEKEKKVVEVKVKVREKVNYAGRVYLDIHIESSGRLTDELLSRVDYLLNEEFKVFFDTIRTSCEYEIHNRSKLSVIVSDIEKDVRAEDVENKLKEIISKAIRDIKELRTVEFSIIG